MGRDRGMGRKGEQQSRNIASELCLRHRSFVRYCTWAEHVSVHEQRSPSQAGEGCWGLHVLHRPPCSPTHAGDNLSPAAGRGVHRFVQIHSPLRFASGLRMDEAKQEKSRVWDREGKGQRKEKQPAWKKWNSYPTVERRYGHLNFITFFLV